MLNTKLPGFLFLTFGCSPHPSIQILLLLCIPFGIFNSKVFSISYADYSKLFDHEPSHVLHCI